MTFSPPVATLNAILNDLMEGGSVYGNTKAQKVKKIIELGGDPTNLENMVRVLSTAYQQMTAEIKAVKRTPLPLIEPRTQSQEETVRLLQEENQKLRAEVFELEDELEEYVPTDFYIHNKKRYYFSHEKQMLYHDREHTQKAGKLNRATKEICWNV